MLPPELPFSACSKSTAPGSGEVQARSAVKFTVRAVSHLHPDLSKPSRRALRLIEDMGPGEGEVSRSNPHTLSSRP
ncbi:hypothetical protein VZT92_022994 [Zoarces viviparus]|uniref:Uncharacterized protein n=1 Tax=Zoarces viviparus TaxID=48416 RepID=A0AAW1E612_ZOAVI